MMPVSQKSTLHPSARLLSYALLLVLLFSSLGAVPAASAAWQSKVDPWVLSAADREETEFIIFLTEQAGLSAAAGLQTKHEKGAYVYKQLSEVAQKSQKPVLAALDEQSADYRSYWVANLIWVRGDIRLVESLARRTDVAHIYANTAVQSDRPAGPDRPVMSLQPAESRNLLSAPGGAEWNITKIGAPEVWAAGFRGHGVVIGGQDTGYDWTHPALKNQYRGWNGSTADHNYNWHDAIQENNPNTSPGNKCGFKSSLPCDDGQHGTHTMGTMLGDDGGNNQVGVAPGAKWIGCRNMEDGWGTPVTYAECYQWFIAPTDLNGENPRPDLAPDIINNSWGCPPAEGCTDPSILLSVVENVRAAGILTVHAAGNSGSACSSVNSPAAIYDASFTVGNTDSNDNISANSSRGPVLIDGSGRIKPDISAPGTGIRSSVTGGGFAELSGTSMAGPHVAGVAALLISTNPSLSGHPDELEKLLNETAVRLTGSQTCGGVAGESFPNNTFGWGRVDAWAAFQALEQTAGVRLTPNQSQSVFPGSAFTSTYKLTNTRSETVTFDLSLESSQGWARLESSSPVTLGPGESVTLIVTVSVPKEAPAGSREITVLKASSLTDTEITASVTNTTSVNFGLFFPFMTWN